MSSDATRARRRQMPIVRWHQVPDAARCQSPDTSCLMPPPGPGGGLGEVSRAPVLMSFVLISGSCCRRQFWSPTACDDERRAPAVKSGVSLFAMSPVQRFCSALSFHHRLLQTFTICGPSVVDLDGCVVFSFRQCVAQTFTAGGPSVTDLDGCVEQTDASGHGVRRRRRTLCSQRLSAHGGGRRTRRIRRAARWLWLPGRLSFEVLYISVYANSILMLKNVTGYSMSTMDT